MSSPVVSAFNSGSLYSIALRTAGLSAACAMIADATQPGSAGEHERRSVDGSGARRAGRHRAVLVPARDPASLVERGHRDRGVAGDEHA